MVELRVQCPLVADVALQNPKTSPRMGMRRGHRRAICCSWPRGCYQALANSGPPGCYQGASLSCELTRPVQSGCCSRLKARVHVRIQSWTRLFRPLGGGFAGAPQWLGDAGPSRNCPPSSLSQTRRIGARIGATAILDVFVLPATASDAAAEVPVYTGARGPEERRL